MGNDVNDFLAACEGDLACIQAQAPAAIAAFSTRLTAILRTLAEAADKDARIVVTGAFDPNPSPLAQLTHPLFEALDQAIAAAAAGAEVRYAPLFATFDSYAALCTLTLLCSDGDAHPSDAGYQAIADRVVEAA